MAPMIDFIIGLFGNLLAGELAAWGPRLADKIVSRAARKLLPELEERMLEEWDALLSDIPGGFSKVMTALSLFYSHQKIRDEFQVDHSKISTSSTPSSSLPILALTPRELSVMEWISVGKTNREISRILGVTEQTVRFHVESIFLKLGVDSRTRAVAVVLECGCWKPSMNPHYFSY
jgi:DNA-binding CsgD family transcriptional regulator